MRATWVILCCAVVCVVVPAGCSDDGEAPANGTSGGAAGQGGGGASTGAGGLAPGGGGAGGGGAAAGGDGGLGGVGGTDECEPLGCAAPANCLLEIPIPSAIFNGMAAVHTVCPSDPDPDATPPECVLEMDLGNVSVTVAGHYHVVGTVPIRVQRLPIDSLVGGISTYSMDSVLTVDDACPPNAQTFLDASLTSDLWSPCQVSVQDFVLGCTDASASTLDLIESEFATGHRFCNNSTFGAAELNQLEAFMVSMLMGLAHDALVDAIDSSGCVNP